MKIFTERNLARMSALASVLVLGSLGPHTLYSSSPVGEQASSLLIQGADVQRLVTLVEGAGGTVKQTIPVLNAVDISVTPSQLETISRSADVHRIIHDRQVAVNGAADACPIGGEHLLARVGDNELVWQVSSRAEVATGLQSVSASWPAAAGTLNSISYGDSVLATTVGNEFVHVEMGELAQDFVAQPGETVEIHLSFEMPVAGIAQSEFSIALAYENDCNVELVRGYDDYANDTYYPTVVKADQLHRMGITGEGVTVAVIDSGLWTEPAGISQNVNGNNRVIATYDATRSAAGAAEDLRGHGTHITSVLANSERAHVAGVEGTSYKGIAPGVNIVAIKAFDESEEGSYLDILRALQFVLDNREELNIRVLNLRFGAEPQGPYWADPVNQMVMEAWRQGIFVVASAGNGGPGPMSVHAPGNNPYVMTVGSVTDAYTPLDASDDRLASFSGAGPTRDGFVKPEIVAPGGHMIGIASRDSQLAKSKPGWALEGDRFMMSGTSQSTAVVAGIAALMLEHEPGLSPDDLKCRITASANVALTQDGTASHNLLQQGAGTVDALAAVNSKATGCANIGMDIEQEIAGLGHYRGPVVASADGTLSIEETVLWDKQLLRGNR